MNVRLLVIAFLIPLLNVFAADTTSFAEFDRRAKAGERLNVVFFGASLTWGANATDPQLTSFRGQIAKRLEETYPLARWKFWDGAIGGTGSQLGVFRFERDVLRHKPDLVFLDFSANDDIGSADPETLASYESLVRRIILDAKAPCVPVIFPFMWNVQSGRFDLMKRRDAHLAIAKAYSCPAGDAIELAVKRVESKQTTLQKLWPFDGVHPGDEGYTVFADAGWDALQRVINDKMTCAAPEKMLYADTYMKPARVRISSLAPLPAGWRITVPNPVSAYFDMLMSRWLDDEVVASQTLDAQKKVTQDVAPLTAKFSGTMLMLFGESTPASCKYRVSIDGKVVDFQPDKRKPAVQEFDAGSLGRILKGNSHHAQVIATGLAPDVEHTLKIEPIFAEGATELRLESICVSGGNAWVK